MNLYFQAYTEALAMIANRQTKDEILCYLTKAAENACGNDAVSSILLLDELGLLRNGASPRLPVDYLTAIDGLAPDPNVGTCAAAAATGSVVVTEDFYEDNKWAELRHLPLALGFKGAWSMPIKNEKGEVLGTFGTYYCEKCIPNQVEIEGVEMLAKAAALAVENSSVKPTE
jgi:GAF domain-containing protein